MTDRRTAKITLTNVRSVGAKNILWDSEVKGFGASGNANGTVTFFVKTRVQGRQRWLTIGKLGSPWTPELARGEAKRLLTEAAGGKDPAPHRHRDREAMLSFADTAARFLKVHGVKLKPATRATYETILRRQIIPAFKGKTIDGLTKTDVARFHAQYAHMPRTANHAVAVISKMISWAEEQGLRPEGPNPCRGIGKFKEVKRERYLSADELTRLGAALADAERTQAHSSSAIAAIRLLMLTGARLKEILTLQWSFLDEDHCVLRLPDSKTGAKTIPLNEPALHIIHQLPRIQGNPYMLPGHISGRHLVNLQIPWCAIRATAGLDDMRLHDLRHSFASVAVAVGGSLPAIGKVLGHSQAQTTARYAHVADRVALELAQATGKRIGAALGIRPSR